MRQRKKPYRWSAIVGLGAALALVAAACGGEASLEDFEQGPLGGVLVAADAPVEIRALQAISGDVAFLGVDQVRGIELAIQDFGAINDHPVNLGTAEDDLCSSEGGTSGANAIAAQENILGVIGTTCSGAGVPAAQILSQAGIPLISGSNTSPALTSDLQGTAGEAWQPGYYRTAHNDLIQGEAAAVFAFEDLGLTRMVMIHDGDPYTEGLANAFAAAFTALGGEVPLITAVNKGDTDMVPILTDAAAESPDGIYFPIFQPEGDFILQQYTGVAGLEAVQMYGADGLITPDHFGRPEAEGVYYSGPDLNFGANAGFTGVTYDQLVSRYTVDYGEAPTAAFHAHTYDATMILLDSISKVAQVDGDVMYVDYQGLRDQIYTTQNFPGVTGTLVCDDFGDCGAQTISVVLNDDHTHPEDSIGNTVFRFGSTGRLPMDG